MNKNALPRLIIQSVLVIILITTCSAPNESFIKLDDTPVQITLKMPPGLFFQRDPRASKKIRFNVDSILNSIWMFSSQDNGVVTFKQKNESRSWGNGKNAKIMAVPLLYKMDKNIADGSFDFHFGLNGGDNNNDCAIVNVSFGTQEVSVVPNINTENIKLQLSFNELYVFPDSTSPVNTDQKFLGVKANVNKQTIIKIDYNEDMGQVMVCIFSEQNKKILATLDPKDSENLEFVTNEDIYILPVILPVPSQPIGGVKNRITFSVGDPKVNGSVTASEE